MLIIHPAPGYLLTRYAGDAERSEGGIILPPGVMRRPIVSVVEDGGPAPRQGGPEDWSPPTPTMFRIAEGGRVVVSGVEAMVELGQDRLFLVPYGAVIASVEEMP